MFLSQEKLGMFTGMRTSCSDAIRVGIDSDVHDDVCDDAWYNSYDVARPEHFIRIFAIFNFVWDGFVNMSVESLLYKLIWLLHMWYNIHI